MKRALLCLPMLALSGCSTWIIRPVRDLQFEAARIVDREEIPTKPMSDARDPSRKYLEVTVSSKVDVGEIATDSELHVGNDVGFCPFSEQSDELFAWGPYIGGRDVRYRNSEDLTAYREAVKPDVQGYYHYDLYLLASRAAAWGPTAPAYDLTVGDRDVCFVIRGGNMLGGSFRSNVVRVPKERIASALRAATTEEVAPSTTSPEG